MGEYTKLVGDVRNAFNTGVFVFSNFILSIFILSLTHFHSDQFIFIVQEFQTHLINLFCALGRTKSVEWRKEQLKAVDRFGHLNIAVDRFGHLNIARMIPTETDVAPWCFKSGTG